MAFKNSQTTGGAYLSDDLMFINANNSSSNVYDKTTLPNTETKITAVDSNVYDFFGTSVDIGDDRIVVGSPYDDDTVELSGSVYTYNLNGTQLNKIHPNDPQYNSGFGKSVAVADGRIVVGAPYISSFYIFDTSGNQIKKITVNYQEYWWQQPQSTFFGMSVAIRNGRIVVGAPNYGSQFSGAIFIYTLDGMLINSIIPDNLTPSSYFGQSVDINNGRIVVGAPNDGVLGRGSCYIYDLNGVLISKIQYPDSTPNVQLGYSVSVGSGRIIVGTRFFGSVFLYDLNGSLIKIINAGEPLSNEPFFGAAVAVGCGRVAVGCLNDPYNNYGNVPGVCYIYDLDGNKLGKISNNTSGSNDYGISVAIGSGKIVVGDDYNNANSGAIYMYNTPLINHALDILD